MHSSLFLTSILQCHQTHNKANMQSSAGLATICGQLRYHRLVWNLPATALIFAVFFLFEELILIVHARAFGFFLGGTHFSLQPQP